MFPFFTFHARFLIGGFREKMTGDIADAIDRFFAAKQAGEPQGVLPH